MLASSITIAGRSLSATPEVIFLTVVATATGLRMAFQGSTWWHHIMDWIIGGVAVTTVPAFGAQISKVTTKSVGITGVCIAIAVIMVLSFWKPWKKK